MLRWKGGVRYEVAVGRYGNPGRDAALMAKLSKHDHNLSPNTCSTYVNRGEFRFPFGTYRLPSHLIGCHDGKM